MKGFTSLMLPQNVFIPSSSPAKAPSKPMYSAPRVIATSAAVEKKYDLLYYLKGALSGGICCAITHGALCPVDVVKTRIQLDPAKYNRGLIGGFGQVIAEEGVAGLATGLGPTVVGYFIQGISHLPSLIWFGLC